MAEQRLSEQDRPAYLSLGSTVWVCRALGVITLGIAFAVGGWAVQTARGDAAWVFLATIMIPIGIGFLILVAAEILSRMGQRE
jgi:ABC-type spermidine/putrescine transport system permease subunit I